MTRIRVFSQLGGDHVGFDVTNERAMAALRDAERRHFWHRSRNAFIAGRLRALGVEPANRFVDLGCGGGCVSAHLSALGLQVVGIDGHRGLLELAARRAPDATFWLHDLSVGVDALPEQRFDAAGLFDVLEHLNEPAAVLREARNMVRRGGWVVGTVPSGMHFWSRTDEQAGHRTRYDADRLRTLLQSVRGCHVQEIIAFHRLLGPLLRLRRVALVRLRDMGQVSAVNLRVPPAPINTVVGALLAAERAVGPALPPGRGGTSLWFAIRRDA